MSKNELPSCAKQCKISGSSCDASQCRYWIDYLDDENCSLISIYKNGPMTLNEVSKRMGVSLVRISQIEKQALTKIKKRLL